MQEVHVLMTFRLANELITDEPSDGLGCPLNRVGDPVVVRLETGSVGMVLHTILGNDVHGEGVLGD